MNSIIQCLFCVVSSLKRINCSTFHPISNLIRNPDRCCTKYFPLVFTISTLGLMRSVCCFSAIYQRARSQDFQFPKWDYFDFTFLHIGGIKIHNQMDVHLPHKVGRQIQLIQHRENEYKSERVNPARVFIFNIYSMGSYCDSVWRLYLWFQYTYITCAFCLTSLVCDVNKCKNECPP